MMHNLGKEGKKWRGRTGCTNSTKDCNYTSSMKLCEVTVHATKACEGVEVQQHTFLTLALGGGQWAASHEIKYVHKFIMNGWGIILTCKHFWGSYFCFPVALLLSAISCNTSEVFSAPCKLHSHLLYNLTHFFLQSLIHANPTSIIKLTDNWLSLL